MRKLGVVIAMLLLVFALTGCSDDTVTLNVYNWGDYIDETVLEEFENETGIKINYETFDTNEAMYQKIKNGGTQYDIAFPSDYMIEKMIQEDMLVELDMAKIPNFDNIHDKFKDIEFDPGNKYSVPYFWGTVGIVYNENLVTDPVDSWDILWDEKYAGQITMIDSERDSLAVALKRLGYSLNTTDLGELEEARDMLIDQQDVLLAYVGDNVKDMLVNEEAAIAVVWSGEAFAIMSDFDHFSYALPKEGSNYWFDNIVIPKDSQNVDAAHQFINFLCDKEIGFRNTDYVGYSTTNSETMKMLDDEILNNPVAYPDLNLLDNFEVFLDLGDFVEEYSRVWTEIKAAQ